MRSKGAQTSARNLVSACHLRKKQFCRGAHINIANRAAAHSEKQMAASWAVGGNSRKASRSFISN